MACGFGLFWINAVDTEKWDVFEVTYQAGVMCSDAFLNADCKTYSTHFTQ